jgi:sugar phosphate isomerase/epimerase
MLLSCLPVSLYDEFRAGRRTLPDWFRLAKSLGLDGADISVAHVPSRAPRDLDDLRDAAGDAGVRIAIVAAYSDFTQPEAVERAGQIEDVRQWIDAAERLGAECLRLTAGQQRADVSESDGLAWATEGLTACLDHARTAGVRLLYENHVRGAAWERNDFTQPAARFIDVVRRTKGTDLAILFDTANNLALDEEPSVVLAAVVDRIGAVHLSDLKRRGWFEPVRVGTGVAPLARLLHVVVESGFDGWVSIEEASRSGADAFPEAVTFADRIWAEAGGAPRASSPR